jgi:hypothetical protein
MVMSSDRAHVAPIALFHDETIKKALQKGFIYEDKKGTLTPS